MTDNQYGTPALANQSKQKSVPPFSLGSVFGLTSWGFVFFLQLITFLRGKEDLYTTLLLFASILSIFFLSASLVTSILKYHRFQMRQSSN